MLACKENDLISKSHQDRKDSKANKSIKPGLNVWDSKSYADTRNDADKYHKEHKACSTARMEALLLHSILGSKLFACLVASDRLMLCAVIHKGSLNFRHKRNKGKVSEENANLNQTLDYRLQNVIHRSSAKGGDDRVNTPSDEDGQAKEEKERKAQTKHKGDPHCKVGRIDLQFFLQPLFKFSLLLLDSESICGILKSLYGERHNLNKVNHSAYDGKIKNLMLLSDRNKLLILGNNGAVLFTDRKTGLVTGLHHNTL